MTQLELKRRQLHGSGRKATPQRLYILDAIDSMRSQFTPGQLYDRLQTEHPDIGLVTVYRTLNLLAEAGLICRMERTGKSQSYARRPEEHHHHLVCKGCDKVVNLASCGLAKLEKQLASDTGFAISEHHLEFVGLCRQCQGEPGRHEMKILSLVLPVSLLMALLIGNAACSNPVATSNKKSIVVTYSILGSIVKELVGDGADVSVSIPDGLDPHEWEPSARDIEKINRADLIVQNGLGLEGGMEKTLAQAGANGVSFFTVSDYITIRHVGPGEGIPSGDPDQVIGAPDPHLWTDPLAMKSIVAALADYLKANLNLDVSARSLDLQARLDGLNGQCAAEVANLPPDSRKLVTGHESMGYFAQRYGFKLVGALIPGLSSQADVSAGDLAALKQLILDSKVKAIFAEVGTSASVADAISHETGAKVVELATHTLPPDGSYFTFEINLATVIVDALK